MIKTNYEKALRGEWPVILVKDPAYVSVLVGDSVSGNCPDCKQFPCVHTGADFKKFEEEAKEYLRTVKVEPDDKYVFRFKKEEAEPK